MVNEKNISLKERLKICNEQFEKTSKQIIELDNKFKNNESNIDTSKYYRYLKTKNNVTKNAYVTIIFCDSKYISSILVTGYYLKHIIKTKYDIVCLVQDRPYYEKDIVNNTYLKFNGLSQTEIEDIKKIYDVVIGIDLFRVNVNKKTSWNLIPRYLKLPYYTTKLLVLGLTQYSKLIYYDASSIIIKNIDFLFDKYNKSTYRISFDHTELKRGLIGNFYLFTPKKYYLEKGVYINDKYLDIVGEGISCFNKDEDLIFYTVYPHWNNERLDEGLFKTNYFRLPYIKIKQLNYDYYVELYMGIKPFFYPNGENVKERDMYNNNNYCYYNWDIGAKELLEKYKSFNKYFEYIKTFRYVEF
jgi:hypothetical protein